MLSDCFKQLKVIPCGTHYPIISLGFDAVIWSDKSQGHILCCNHIPATTISPRKNSLKLPYLNHLYRPQPSLPLPVEFNVIQIFWAVCFFFSPSMIYVFCSGKLELSYSKPTATVGHCFPPKVNSLRLSSYQFTLGASRQIQNHASNRNCFPNLF